MWVLTDILQQWSDQDREDSTGRMASPESATHWLTRDAFNGVHVGNGSPAAHSCPAA